MRKSQPLAPPGTPAQPPNWMQALGHSPADRRIQVLQALSTCGSISGAARQVGISYKAAWQAITTLSNLAGVPVVEKSVGGTGGGGATLTAAGEDLLRAAHAMVEMRGAVLQQWPTQPAAHHVVQRLHMQTSMRNQWPCTIAQVDISGPLALVHAHSVHGPLHISARITTESAQLLGLQTGTNVLAMCKATAVEVSAWTATAPAALNTWPGKATQITRGSIGDEVTTQMAPGVQWVGFAASGSPLRTGRKVCVHIPPSAVVLALDC